MKQLSLIVAAGTLLIMSCGKKTIPAKTTTTPTTTTKPANKPAKIDSASQKKEKEEVVEEEMDKKEETSATTLTPMIVVDGMGKILTPKNQLPTEIAEKADYTTLGRAFTPNQRTNLIYRYKIVPPRVLFVPEPFIQTSAKGKYIVYRKKFWYWQKQDGLFYLDETYYK